MIAVRELNVRPRSLVESILSTAAPWMIPAKPVEADSYESFYYYLKDEGFVIHGMSHSGIFIVVTPPPWWRKETVGYLTDFYLRDDHLQEEHRELWMFYNYRGDATSATLHKV